MSTYYATGTPLGRPTPPAKDSLGDTYADIHAARRADMHAATAMYTHVTTLGAAVATGPYMLTKTTISSIRLFMKRLPEYTRLGGTLRWVHLLTRVCSICRLFCLLRGDRSMCRDISRGVLLSLPGLLPAESK